MLVSVAMSGFGAMEGGCGCVGGGGGGCEGTATSRGYTCLKALFLVSTVASSMLFAV